MAPGQSRQGQQPSVWHGHLAQQPDEEWGMQLSNFGRNIRFEPTNFFLPRDEAEVLEILRRYRGQSIRVVGRLHSWSEAPVGSGIVLDLRYLDSVRLEERDGETRAVVGAGIQLKALVELLNQRGYTLPSLGLIMEQSLAGATATGTHGSGKHCLSGYIDEVRVAHYSAETGEPVVRCIRDGDELRAAACALGCMGVVLSVGMRCRPQYRLEQHFQLVQDLEHALDFEPEYPQQQFYLLPFRWDYLVQLRRESSQPTNWLTYVHRWYWYLTVDVALHVVLIVCWSWLRSRSLLSSFYRWLVPVALIRNWKVIDHSPQLLTMDHDLFRHIEVEVFVPRSQLSDSLSFVKQLLQYLDGDRQAFDPPTWQRLVDGQVEAVVRDCPTYTHHYPICVRKVLADDLLLSMASSSEEDYYAISFISYQRPEQRASFFAFAETLVRTTAVLFGARPHWGKHCPLDAAQAEQLYPQLSLFHEQCAATDPQGVFRNAWCQRVLWGQNAVPAINH